MWLFSINIQVVAKGSIKCQNVAILKIFSNIYVLP